MKAIDKYIETSKRCDSIVLLWKELNGNPKCLKGPFKHDDLIRAVIVFKVAAMDHYFTNKFMELLVPFLKKKGPTIELSKLIEDSGITFKEALNLIRDEKPFKKIETKVYAKLNKYVTQNVDKIDSLFICFGIKSLSSNAEKFTKKIGVLRNINTLVKRRHAIVHQGDIGNKGKVKAIGKNHILKKLFDTDSFVTACDTILNNIIK